MQCLLQRRCFVNVSFHLQRAHSLVRKISMSNCSRRQSDKWQKRGPDGKPLKFRGELCDGDQRGLLGSIFMAFSWPLQEEVDLDMERYRPCDLCSCLLNDLPSGLLSVPYLVHYSVLVCFSFVSCNPTSGYTHISPRINILSCKRYSGLMLLYFSKLYVI